MNNVTQALHYYLSTEGSTISGTCRKFKVEKDSLIKQLVSQKYFLADNGKNRKSIIHYHDAAEEYINSDYWNISLSSIARKYNISSGRLSKYIDEFYPSLNILDESVFDSIDTEEKAYWLGFIFADGTISSSPLDNNQTTQYQFELSLKLSDINHLEKAKKFFGYKRKLHTDSCRCRLEFNSKHLWDILNSYGCTPRKSLTLKFPDKTIFKDKSLIRHFIRGYWDGDGCLTYKRLGYPTISVLGTEHFLTNIQLILNTSNTLYNNNNKETCITKVLKYNGVLAYNICKYMYNDCTIYLDRKYEKYLEYCRLYEESCKEPQTKIGEGCDVNPEVITEIKESVAP